MSLRNVGTTIVTPPKFYNILIFLGGRFVIVNSRSQLSPQIKKTNQNHSTTIKRIKKKEKNTLKKKKQQKQCEPKKLFIIACTYLQLQLKGLQGGTLCGPVFCNFLIGLL